MATLEMLLLQRIVLVSNSCTKKHNACSYICFNPPVCDCNPVGSMSKTCDHQTGQCLCLPNVEGIHCDLCSAGYFGLNSGTGCTACNCNLQGSVDAQCDPVTGQCSCKAGVTGYVCDQCIAGFFGLSMDGCRGE